jgi:hypothetical protein
LHAAEIFSRTIVSPRSGCLRRCGLGITFGPGKLRRNRERPNHAGSSGACSQKISALHNFLPWSVVLPYQKTQLIKRSS